MKPARPDLYDPAVRLWWCCLTAFLGPLALGGFFVALPFAVVKLGGADRAVGIAGAAQAFAYCVGCWLGAAHLDHLNPNRCLRIGAAGFLVGVLLALAAVLPIWAGHFMGLRLIALVLVAAGLGAAAALVWPVLLGWITRGSEGAALSRRLAWYNASWSGAVLVAPLIAGALAQIGPEVAIAAGAALLLLMNVHVNFVPHLMTRRDDADPSGERGAEPMAEVPHGQTVHIAMARIGLLATFACGGLARSQMALLYRFELGYSEAVYGLVLALIGLSTWLGFVALGRWHAWQSRPWIMPLTSLLAMGTMAVTAVGTTLPVLITAMILLGPCYSLCFVTHVHYSVAGRLDRSRRMAWHELCIWTGVFAGNLSGGYIAAAAGRRAPYWTMAAVLAGAAVVQTILYRRTRHRAQPPAASSPSPPA